MVACFIALLIRIAPAWATEYPSEIADLPVAGGLPEQKDKSTVFDAPLGRIEPAKINPNGSSLATGHPFAATGARIVATAAKELAQRGGGRCLISICTAGGMGVVAILER